MKHQADAMKKLILCAAFVLSGCAGDQFVGSPHAYQGDMNGVWYSIRALPTVVPDGAAPMGYRNGAEEDIYTTFYDGTVRATGRAAWAMALARLCAVAPTSRYCGPADSIGN